EQRVDVDVAVVGQEDGGSDRPGRQRRYPRRRLGGRYRERAHTLRHVEGATLVLEEQDTPPREERGLGEARRPPAEEGRPAHLEPLQRRVRVDLDERGRAPAAGVGPGMLLALDDEDVAGTPLGKGPGEREAGGSTSGDEKVGAHGRKE